MKHSVEDLNKKTYEIRRRFLELFTKLGFGQLVSSFSWAEIAVVLYYEIMHLPESQDSADLADRLVLSKGHGAGILFPIFEDIGYFTKEEMENTLKIGGDTRKLRQLICPGFDFYGGSLGIGIGVAAGLAKGFQMNGTPQKTYCLVGDAECYEGSVWEAAHFAAHQGLEGLIVLVDRNQLGVSGFTEQILRLEPLREKWLSSGWDVSEVDGHDVSEIYNALNEAAEQANGKPKCIIANTKKGQGLEYMVDRPLMHGYMPTSREEIARAFEKLR